MWLSPLRNLLAARLPPGEPREKRARGTATRHVQQMPLRPPCRVSLYSVNSPNSFLTVTLSGTGFTQLFLILQVRKLRQGGWAARACPPGPAARRGHVRTTTPRLVCEEVVSGGSRTPEGSQGPAEWPLLLGNIPPAQEDDCFQFTRCFWGAGGHSLGFPRPRGANELCRRLRAGPGSRFGFDSEPDAAHRWEGAPCPARPCEMLAREPRGGAGVNGGAGFRPGLLTPGPASAGLNHAN